MKRTALAALLLLLSAQLASPAEAGEPVVGELHPELRLPTIDGEGSLSLHAQRGTKVLLIQFASW